MKLLLLLPLILCSCASIEGGIEYAGQYGSYRVSYDGKTIRPVIILKDPKGYRK